jgi:hypothetical protein
MCVYVLTVVAFKTSAFELSGKGLEANCEMEARGGNFGICFKFSMNRWI